MSKCFVLLGQINYLAVLVCVVYTAILGSIWYSPKVFFNVWAKAIKMNMTTPPDKKKAMTAMIVMLVMSASEMFGLAAVIALTGGGIVKALHVGVIIAVLMSLANRISEAGFEGRPPIAWMISGGYKVLNLVGAAVILGLWK